MDDTRDSVSQYIDKTQSTEYRYLDLRLGNNDNVHVPVHVAVPGAADVGGQELCVCIAYVAVVFGCVRGCV